MNQKIVTLFELPHSTADCDHGPKIEFTLGVMKLSYDYEGEDAKLWLTLEFDGAVATRFTPDISVTEQMVSAYSKVCECVNSEWLSQLVLEARKHGSTFPNGLKHVFVYFDHYGCVEALARDVKIVDEGVKSPIRSADENRQEVRTESVL